MARKKKTPAAPPSENIHNVQIELIEAATKGAKTRFNNLLKKWGNEIPSDTLGICLKDAAENGHSLIIHALFSQVGDKIKAEDIGMALKLAAEHGHEKAVQKIMTHVGGEISAYAKGQAYYIATQKGFHTVAQELLKQFQNEIDLYFKQMAFEIYLENGEIVLIQNLLEKSTLPDKLRLLRSLLHKPSDKARADVYLKLLQENETSYSEDDKEQLLTLIIDNKNISGSDLLLILDKYGKWLPDELLYATLERAVESGNLDLFQKVVAETGTVAYVDENRIKLLHTFKESLHPEIIKMLFDNPDHAISPLRAGLLLFKACRLQYFGAVSILLHHFEKSLLQKDIEDAYFAAVKSECPEETRKSLLNALPFRKRFVINVSQIYQSYIHPLVANFSSNNETEVEDDSSQSTSIDEDSEHSDVLVLENGAVLQYMPHYDHKKDEASDDFIINHEPLLTTEERKSPSI